jgi:glycosyltransferase involved in cell wall biosynthesis
MKSILFVNNTGKWGGAEKVMLNSVVVSKGYCKCYIALGSRGELYERLVAIGLRDNIFIYNSNDMADEEFVLFGVKFFNPVKILKNILSLLLSIRKIKKIVKINKIDIVLANNLQAILICSFSLVISKVKLVWHEHSIQPTVIRRIILDLVGLLVPKKIISVSNAVKDSHYSFIHNKISVIYNGFDFSKLDINSKKTLRHEFGLPDNQLIVAIPAVLRRWKGHMIFIEAAKLVLDNTDRDVKFLIIGGEVLESEAGYKESLLEKVNSLGIQKNVVFTGHRQNVYQIMCQDMDILVSASTSPDPLPTIVLEAMSSGTAIVASNVGGVQEMIGSNTGRLVCVNDPYEMAKAILELVENPSIRGKLACNAKDRFNNTFTLGIYKENFIKLIKEL